MENNIWNQKDKRISWLSIFSSLTQTSGVDVDKAVDKAFDINRKLYQAYPFPQEDLQRMTPEQINLGMDEMNELRNKPF